MGTAVRSAPLAVLPSPSEAQSWTQLQPSAPCFTDPDMNHFSLQRPWSHPMCPSTIPPLGLSSPTGILAEAIPVPHTSKSTRGR